MKYYLLITIAVLCNRYGFSQKENYNWAIGDSAGLIFSDTIVNFFNSNLISFECSSSISDSSGNLLFYTNGNRVWNSVHSIMPNGTGLEISSSDDTIGSSITQGVVIVPKPLSTNLYYIIYRTDIGIKYSIVDMNMDEGYGDIIGKNIVLDTSLYQYTEKMQVIKHGNGRDYWLVLYAGDDYVILGDTMMFISYLISPEGIEGPVLVQDASPYTVPYGTIGQMKFSVDGSMLANTRYNNIDLYNFDRCSGALNLFYTISNEGISDSGFYGCEISSDNTKLYTSYLDYPITKKPLLQYCLDCEIEISDTKDTIYYFTNKKEIVGQMQIGPDDKIYITTNYADSVLQHNFYNTHISVINNPNELGELADLDLFAIELPSGRSNYGLPNICDYSLGVLVGSECDTSSTAIYDEDDVDNNITIYPNPAADELYFSSNNYFEGYLTISDLSGKIYLKDYAVTSTSTIDLSDFHSGLYIIKLISNNQIIFNDKLLILK